MTLRHHETNPSTKEYLSLTNSDESFLALTAIADDDELYNQHMSSLHPSFCLKPKTGETVDPDFSGTSDLGRLVSCLLGRCLYCGEVMDESYSHIRVDIIVDLSTTDPIFMDRRQ